MAAQPATQITAGWGGAVLTAGFKYNVTRWRWQEGGTVLRSQTSNTNKNTVILPTFPNRTVVVEYEKDVANDATVFFGTTPTIYFGATIALELVEDLGASTPVGYHIPTAVITGVERDVVIAGKVTGRFTAEVSGTYTNAPVVTLQA